MENILAATNAVSKHTNLGFKPNPSSMYRMPYNPPVATQLSGKWMTKMPDMPSKHYFENSAIYRGGYVTTSYEDGYASAMEPMDNDEWGEEGYWMGDSTHDQMNSIPAKRKSPYVHAPSDNPAGKNLKSVPLPYAKQMSPCGPNLMSKPLRQSLLKIDSSKGLTVKLEPKPQKTLAIRKLENGRAVFPKWSSSSPTSGSKMDLDGKDASFPRVFTVTVERLLQWPKMLTGSRAIFELYGILDSVSAGKYPHSQIIVLRSEKFKDYLTCTFFEIDRALPPLEKNKWQRCILLVRSNTEYQCLKIRSATSNELKNLDPMVTKSSKSKALLLKSIHA